MSIQNEILNAIASRRSCRAYKPEQITAEELEAVTTAGTWAATAMGRQSPVMVAVQDKETLAELSRLNAAVMGTQNDPFYGAPTAVLVLGEKNNPNGVQDASLVMAICCWPRPASVWAPAGSTAQKRRLKRPMARLCWPSGALIPRSTSASATAFLAIPRPMAPAHPAPARPAMSCTYDFRRRHRPV